MAAVAGEVSQLQAQQWAKNGGTEGNIRLVILARVVDRSCFVEKRLRAMPSTTTSVAITETGGTVGAEDWYTWRAVTSTTT